MSNSIFNNDDNLPGVYIEVQDNTGYKYDTSLFGTTDSIVVIGTAFNGPVNQPVAIYNPEHAKYIFGAVFDPIKRQEASLMAGIQDAWDRGCRTIYGVRISGKDMHKDFHFCTYTMNRIRLSSAFPSNITKDCYIRYDNTPGNETIYLYKPASRATIAERKRGDVKSANSILVKEIKLAQSYGYNSNTPLVEVIRMLNQTDSNNVIVLTIVDRDGKNITNSTEAYNIPLGALLPGVYFIGRDHSECLPITSTKLLMASENSDKVPYDNFEDIYFRSLEINTDVRRDYPIYFDSARRKEFASYVRDCGVIMSTPWDFLEVTGAADVVFSKDKVDYEETKLSTFDIYKRLGNGYTITAVAEKRGVGADGKDLPPRIREANVKDIARMKYIDEGTYSAIESAEIKYRVLTHVGADTKISAKLPKPADFLKTSQESLSVLNDYMTLTTKVAEDDFTKSKAYKVTFNKITSPASDTSEDIYAGEVFTIADTVDDIAKIIPEEVENDTFIMIIDGTNDNKLVKVLDDVVTIINDLNYVGNHFIVSNKLYVGDVDSSSNLIFVEENFTFNSGTSNYEYTDRLGTGYEYILGEALDTVFVFQPVAANEITPLGDVNTMFGKSESDEAAMLLTFAESMPFKDYNTVNINSAYFDSMTLEELVTAINDHPVLNQLFTASLTPLGAEVKDYIVDSSDVADTELGKTYVLTTDRTTGYDYTMHIPYRTTDNFARQLAQHCTYTELKTCPTHGFIGFDRQTDSSLVGLSKKVDLLSRYDYDMFAKNAIGQNMLDRNNEPYDVGRNVSCVFGQYLITVGDENYTYLSQGAPGYAGMVSILPLDQSSTNQSINLSSLTFNLTTSQLTKLTAAGIVTFKNSVKKGIVVTDGITMAPATSSFRRLACSRIMHAVEDLIRQEAEVFIGKQNHTANRDALHTAIKSALDKLVNTLIEKYEFSLSTDPNALKFTYIDINYTIVPINEIREIRNYISVQDEL